MVLMTTLNGTLKLNLLKPASLMWWRCRKPVYCQDAARAAIQLREVGLDMTNPLSTFLRLVEQVEGLKQLRKQERIGKEEFLRRLNELRVEHGMQPIRTPSEPAMWN
jgi:hypothetical protein